MDQTLSLAERIRSAINTAPVKYQAGEITMTASLGVAIGCDQIGENFGKLIAAADEALYRAKNAGRNRIEFSN